MPTNYKVKSIFLSHLYLFLVMAILNGALMFADFHIHFLWKSTIGILKQWTYKLGFF